MPFHSAAFVLLFVPTLALYWLLPARFQHLVLLVSSLAFYYYAGLLDTAILLGSVAGNHLISIGVERERGSGRRGYVTAAVVFNLAVLSFFKYRGFVAENLNTALGLHLPIAKSEIPLGISFYLFQLIAYQVDLHRGEIDREPRFWRVLLYILFFPHHQAGPIMRPAKFLPQFYGEKRWERRAFEAGAFWILFGLAKKVAADTIAGYANGSFDAALGGDVSTRTAWTAALTFGFQIYGDFSGYSDIAVGLGLMLGYQLDVNFKQPYVSQSPSEFWRRWHVTLSQWLRDYLYIGLGGNRRGPVRTYVNLLLTMVLGGLWHGASWMFVIWGAIHGLFLVIDRRFPKLLAHRALGVALTFVVVHAAWVPFRAVDLRQTGRILGAMFVPRLAGDTMMGWVKLLALAGGLCLFYAVEHRLRERGEAVGAWWSRRAPALRGLLLAAAAALILVNVSAVTSYIYFRF